MSAPGDVTDNYVRLMAERGWSWDDLADEFDRQAAGPPMPLDRGASARGMARWARSNAEAGRVRAGVLQQRGEPAEDTEVWDRAAARAAAADQRRKAADDPGQPDPRPDDAAPDAPPRKAVPPAPSRRA